MVWRPHPAPWRNAAQVLTKTSRGAPSRSSGWLKSAEEKRFENEFTIHALKAYFSFITFVCRYFRLDPHHHLLLNLRPRRPHLHRHYSSSSSTSLVCFRFGFSNGERFRARNDSEFAERTFLRLRALNMFPSGVAKATAQTDLNFCTMVPAANRRAVFGADQFQQREKRCRRFPRGSPPAPRRVR